MSAGMPAMRAYLRIIRKIACRSRRRPPRLSSRAFSGRPRSSAGAGLVEVVFDGDEGGSADGHDALFGALAGNAREAELEVDVLDVEAADLRDARAGGVEQFQRGPVAPPQQGGGFGRVEQGVDLFGVEEVGQVFRAARGLDQRGGVGGEEALADGEAVEHLDGDEFALDGRGGHTAGVEVLDEARHVVAADLAGRAAEAAGEGIGEIAQVAGVGGAGVGAKAAFDREVVEQGVDKLFVVLVHRRFKRVPPRRVAKRRCCVGRLLRPVKCPLFDFRHNGGIA